MSDGGPLTILLVEDDPTDAALFKALLGHTRDFRQEHVDTLVDARERLATDEPVDLIVLDLGLPDSPPQGTYLAVREVAPDIPVIVLTNLDDDAAAYQALADGAQDYLVKHDVTETLLSKAIRYAIERQVAVRRLRRQRAEELAVYASVGHDEDAGTFGESPLADVASAAFADASRRYGELLDLTVADGYAAAEDALNEPLQALVADLAALDASPSDLGNLYAQVLEERRAALDAVEFAAVLDAGRLLLLRITGELTHEYQRRGGGDEATPPPEEPEEAPPLPPDAAERLEAALAELLESSALVQLTLAEVADAAGLPPASVQAELAGLASLLPGVVEAEHRRRHDIAATLGPALLAAHDEADACLALVTILVELWGAGRSSILAALGAAGDDPVQDLRYRHLRDLTDRALAALDPHLPMAGAAQVRAGRLAMAELFAVLDQKLLIGELFPVEHTREEALAELAHRLRVRLVPELAATLRAGRTSGPDPVEPVVAEPDVAEPDVAEPDVAEPDVVPAGDDAEVHAARVTPERVAVASPADELPAEHGEADAEDAEEQRARLTGADYSAWASRMRNRRRSEIDALVPEPVKPTVDERWSPESLFRDPDE